MTGHCGNRSPITGECILGCHNDSPRVCRHEDTRVRESLARTAERDRVIRQLVEDGIEPVTTAAELEAAKNRKVR